MATVLNTTVKNTDVCNTLNSNRNAIHTMIMLSGKFIAVANTVSDTASRNALNFSSLVVLTGNLFACIWCMQV